MDKKEFLQRALEPTKSIISPPAPLVPFADWDYYYTVKPLEWIANAGSNAIPSKVSVPAGFVTDLASVPSPFWSDLPPAARYSYPAILHDYLYWYQPCDRTQADDVLNEAMQDMDVSIATRLVIYNAVRLAGGLAWSKNAAARAAGEKRQLKKFPEDVRIAWPDWKQKPDVFTDQG